MTVSPANVIQTLAFLLASLTCVAKATIMEPEHLSAIDGKSWVLSSQGAGLQVLDAQGNTLHSVPGSFDQSDYEQVTEDQGLVAAINTTTNSLDLFVLSEKGLEPLISYSEAVAQLTGVCLYKDKQTNLVHGLLLRDEQPSVQRILYDIGNAQPVNATVRELPGGSSLAACQAINDRIVFFEEGFGIWSMAANSERDTARRMLLSARDMTSVDGGPLAALAANEEYIFILSQYGALAFAPTGEISQISDKVIPASEVFALYFDHGKQRLTWAAYNLEHTFSTGEIVTNLVSAPPRQTFVAVSSLKETEPMEGFGDAADDPAIWVHPQDPAQSLILGTDKTRGLASYGLNGELLQFVNAGRLNNVDLRSFRTRDGKDKTLVAASHRDKNAISLFWLDHATRGLSEAGEIPTGLTDVYGLCSGFDPSEEQVLTLINSKDGRYEVYGVDVDTPLPKGHLRSAFQLPDQPEGCVMDDQTGRVFVGVEDHGIWTWNLSEPEAAPVQILSVGGPLKDDVEGLALYQQKDRSLLVVSSQGNDSYALYDSVSPFRYRGSFQITTNLQSGIDGASETDGLEVTSQPLGKDYPNGLLVVQDGRNVMPVAPQNFKLVSFERVLNALNLTHY